MFGCTKRDAFKCSVKASCYIDCKLLLTASTKACITSSRWQVDNKHKSTRKDSVKTAGKQAPSKRMEVWHVGNKKGVT